MHVIATAGHVDHGKSTLVGALTGMDPNPHAEEKRRGLSIDLGYVWTRLDADQLRGDTASGDCPDDSLLAFVDVPGHERFIGTTLAGLGPAPAVMFVVAADEGWRRQSTQHLAAVDALGLSAGVLAVTRSDLADPGPAMAEARERLASTSLADVPAVGVSAVTGAGLVELRAQLADVVAEMPPPITTGRVRLWLDRAFSIRGAGTVVTGTLGAGRITVGDRLSLGLGTVRVRGLQTLGVSQETVSAVARVAVNLRGIDVSDVRRGDVLTTPEAWPMTSIADVQCLCPEPQRLPVHVVAHMGTASIPARVRILGGAMARLTLQNAVPVEPGDRIVLRDSGRGEISAGAIILDVEPPELRRRGSAHQRARALTMLQTADPATVLAEQVRRRRAVRGEELVKLGVPSTDRGKVVEVGAWLIAPDTWTGWQRTLGELAQAQAFLSPLEPPLTVEAARHRAGIPDRSLVEAAAQAAGLIIVGGRLDEPRKEPLDLGPAEEGLQRLERQLATDPFRPPSAAVLASWGLGSRELAAAIRAGRVIRLGGSVILLPDAPERAHDILAALAQPFSVSRATQALRSSRRVTIPLLEHLDQLDKTVRSAAGMRTTV